MIGDTRSEPSGSLMPSEDDSSLWCEKHAAAYESENYERGLAGWVMRRSHALLEKDFGPDVHFARVLEVGAGSGVHLRYVRHSFESYVMTDTSSAMLERVAEWPRAKASGTVSARVADAAHLDLPDASVDRLIATHVLEHLPQPQLVMEEWLRVVRPGGVLSIVLPCDPGMLWRLGRHFGPRARGRSRGLEYDYVMALEHINPVNNLVAIIRHHALRRRERWWPAMLPSMDLNLIYAVNITR